MSNTKKMSITKNKRILRILSLLLCLCVLFSCVPLTVSAAAADAVSEKFTQANVNAVQTDNSETDGSQTTDSQTDDSHADESEIAHEHIQTVQSSNDVSVQSADASTDSCEKSGCTGVYENGFCSVCGSYQSAKQNSNRYEIGNAGQLYWFAALVNGRLSDVSQNSAADAVLTADITVNKNLVQRLTIVDGKASSLPTGVRSWTAINLYSGTFDGCGYKISGLTALTGNAALFKKIESGGKVCNVTVCDGYFGNSSAVAGIATDNYGTISGCVSDVVLYSRGYGLAGIAAQNFGTVEKCLNKSSGKGYTDIGGIVGANYGTVNYCGNTGDFTGTRASNANIGGIVGGNRSGSDYTGTVKNCYSTGTIVGSGTDFFSDGRVYSYNVGSVVGSAYDGTIENCYYIKGTATDAAGLVQNGRGGNYEGGVWADTQGITTGVDKEQFESGEVAYLLNGGNTNGYQVWYQTLSTDTVPNFTGATVFKALSECDNAYHYNNIGSGTQAHIYVGGTCVSCSQKCTHSFTNGICTTCDEVLTYLDKQWNAETKTMETTEKIYTGSVTNFQNTSETVNSGWYYVTGQVDIGAKRIFSGTVHLILCDGAKLNLTGITQLTSGNSWYIYSQSEDPETMGTLFSPDYQSKGGVGIGSNTGRKGFGNLIINGGNITANGNKGGSGIGNYNGYSGGSLTVNGGIVNANGSRYYAEYNNYSGAGIGGTYLYNGRITGSGAVNVTINGGIVNATSGDSDSNGIGAGKKGTAGTVTINGGTVTAKGDGTGIGGTVIINGGNVKGSIGGTPKNSAGTAVSCKTFTLDGATAQKKLNGLSGLDYGFNDVYTLDTNKLYFYLPSDSGNLTQALTTDGVVYEPKTAGDTTLYCTHTRPIDNWCKFCGAYVNGNEKFDKATQDNNGVYLIYTADQLSWFEKYANIKDISINGKLMADIDLGNREWTPIGTPEKPYTGTFDGNGKTITNLKITATQSNRGLFGAVSGGTVKNFTVKGNVYICAADTSGENGVQSVGVVGWAHSGATIDGVTSYLNINDTGKTASTHNRFIGGVVGFLGYPDIGNDTKAAYVENSKYYGKINMQTARQVGGVVGTAVWYSEILLCENRGTVTSGTDSCHIGGIAGDAQTNVSVTKCINYGNVTSGGTDCIGGVVAYANDGTKIEYCGNVGTVSCTNANGGYIGGVLGYINNNAFGSMANCYNYGTISTISGSGNHAGAVVGWCRNSNVSMFKNNYWLDTSYSVAYNTTNISAVQKNLTQFKSGNVTYTLNGESPDGIYKQTIGTDFYPVFSGGTVYCGYACGNGSSDLAYANTTRGLLDTPSPNHAYTDGICQNENCGAYDPCTGKGTAESPYIIKNTGNLLWFATQVNGGKTDIHGKVGADIDTKAVSKIGIGTSDNPYSGTFDGDLHTIKLTLKSTENYTAIFPYVNGATIKNLNVGGTIATSHKFAASIVGQVVGGDVKLEKCLSSVTINSSVRNDGSHGGLVANVSDGTLLISNCGFTGSIKSSNTTNCGGFVGWVGDNKTTTIKNSYIAASFDKTDGCNTFARNHNYVTVTNCYYLKSLNEIPDGAVQKNAEEFASGKVTYQLNENSPNGVWKQTLKTDAYPNFNGGTVYRTEPCAYYQNTKPDGVKEHNYNENGICTQIEGATHYQPAVWNEKDGVYEISNAGQLCWFSCLVNGTLEDTKQNQSANAVLKNDIDMQGVTGYVPIGGTTGLYYSSEGTDKGYKGVFDGNCYVIKNLTVTGSNEKELTYGVFGTLSGTVKNLGVENFNFTLGNKDCRAGGIAGQIISGGYVKDCYVANSAITATGKVAGALAGCNYGGIIENCFTYKVSVTATRTGGIVGDNRGDGGDNDRKGYVINCYTDVSAIENDGRKGNVFNSAASISETDFASGKFAYNLNDKSSNGVWKQTVNTDKYPNFTGETVYATGENCSPNSVTGYGNTKTDTPEHIYKDGICTQVEGEEHYQAAVWNEKESVYEIANKGQLLWFAEKANNGEVFLNGKLTEDIDISSKSDFAIGTSTLPYIGTFDGNGHSLKIKIDSTEQSAAPFPYVNGATIKNLTLFGSVSTTKKFASSIIGTVSDGDVKIEKCLSFVEIDTEVSGDGTHGGLVGNMSAGSLTINNCGFAGAIVGESTSSCGGLVGWTNNDINITNSYVAATFEINSDGSNTFSRNYSKAKLSNCYYLTALNETPSGATQKSAQQFASGEVAYLLQASNGDTLVWGQVSNSDGLLPIITDNEEYKVLPVKSGTSVVGYSLRQKGETNFDGQVDITDYQNAVNIMFGDNNTKAFAEKYDINSDGTVDVGDLFAAQKSGMSDSDYKKLLEKVEECESMCYMKNADFDLDGIVDILDCVFLERLLGGHTFAHPGHGYTYDGIEGHTYDDNGNCICGATDCVYDSETNTYTVYTARALYVWCDAASKDSSANLTLGADITLPAKKTHHR